MSLTGKDMKKRKSILFYNNYYTYGGTEVFLKYLARYLSDRGYDVTVAAAPRVKADFHKPYGPGIKYVWRPFLKRGVKKHSLIWFLDHIYYRLFEAATTVYLSLREYDIAVAVKDKWIMRNSLKLRGRRKFVWVHTDRSTWTDLHSDCFASNEEELACMRKYEKVVCVSEAALNGIRQIVGDPGNLTVKYLPIDVERIIRMSTVPCPVNRTNDRPLVVSVGRLDPEKQYPMLLKACATLHEDVPFDLWIVGEGVERPILEDFISREKLDFVQLLGMQENPYNYLAQADLFVSSSRTESYGLAVQEALILGIPVVAVRCPGIEEALDQRFGVITNNNTDTLSDAIRFFLQNPDVRKRYRDAIEKQFRKEDLFEKRLEAIAELWENPAE